MVNSGVYYRSAIVHADRKGVTIDSDEQDPVSGQWLSSRQTYGVAFRITTVAPRTSHELYVAGVTATGEDVVERWELPVQTGAYMAENQRSSSPIGTPLPSSQMLIQVQGGSFVPPGSRTGPLRPTKDQIFSGFDTQGIDSMTVDPEGRFLIVLGGTDGTRTLYRIENAPGSAATALYSAFPDTFMFFADGVQARQRQDLGRVYFLDSNHGNAFGTYASLLFDLDNDGVFDSVSTYTYAGYRGAGLVDTLWSDFVNQY